MLMFLDRFIVHTKIYVAGVSVRPKVHGDGLPVRILEYVGFMSILSYR